MVAPPPPNEQVGGDVTPRKDSIEGSEHFYPYFSRFSRSPLSRVRREGKNYYLVNGTIDSDYSWASSIPDTGRYWLHWNHVIFFSLLAAPFNESFYIGSLSLSLFLSLPLYSLHFGYFFFFFYTKFNYRSLIERKVLYV